MTDSETWETTDVVICGCGPTGAMLSAYLGQFGISNIVLEKEADITTDPRGIALDEEGIRLVQGLGIYKHIFTEIGTCMHEFQFISGSSKNLSRKPFMVMDYATTEGGTGHVGFICHKQPMLEKHLRMAMATTSHSQLRSQMTVNHISVDEDWVYCRYLDAEGAEKRIRGKYLVGADGKTGFTRKKYLEERGIMMEKTSKTDYNETWVALNWKISLPTPKTHPEFPLWQLGYTPETVYDAFFPTNFRFLCNPVRPAVCGRFGLPSDRLWRFEFVVLKGEDGQEMASPAMIRKIVTPYLRHSGSRYGLSTDVEYPSDCIEVLRCRAFTFSARSCNRWADGRVMLCGDAAHVFPPFGGQGIASGFRDAISLAWRLAIASRLEKSDATKNALLFESWYLERKQQLERSLASTVENGSFVTEGNAVKSFLRDWYLWLLQLVPRWRHRLRLGNRREGMTQYKHHPGLPFVQSLGGGICFPQVYCRGISATGQYDRVQFTDDVIWRPGSSSIFRLVLLIKSVNELGELLQIVQSIPQFRQKEMQLQNLTIIVEEVSACLPENTGDTVDDDLALYRVASGNEFASSSLCERRPRPDGYNPYRIGVEMDHKKLIFLRPDRFVFAACSTRNEALKAAAEIAAFLEGSSYAF